MIDDRKKFLTHVSHEMRTPMNAIVAFSELAMESGNIDEIKIYLEDIYQSAKDLVRIINEHLEGTEMERVWIESGAEGKTSLEEEKKNFSLDETTAILVVDDNEVNLKVAYALLNQYGVKPDVALSGVKAVEKAGKKQYDLILMDYMMPEMDGRKTMEAIREEHPSYERVPIVALTANAVQGAREAMLEQGFDDYLSKPVYKEHLEELLKKWLGSPIPGIQMQVGIINCGEEIEVYRSILQFLAENGRERSEDLDRFLEAEDFENYTIAVHSLKSTLANIGALQQSEMARKLEMAGKEGRYEDIRQGHEALMEAYETVLGNICKYLEKDAGDRFLESFLDGKEPDGLEDEADSDKLSREELEFVMEDVAGLLKEFRYDDAESVIREMLEFNMENSIRSTIQEILKDISNLRIEEALEKIQRF